MRKVAAEEDDAEQMIGRRFTRRRRRRGYRLKAAAGQQRRFTRQRRHASTMGRGLRQALGEALAGLMELRYEERLPVLPSRRQSRSEHREHLAAAARAVQAKKTVAVAGISTLTLTPLTDPLAEASGLNTMTEVPAEFQTLLDARQRLHDYRSLRHNVSEARQAVATARKQLDDARRQRVSSREALAAATEALAQAERNLKKVTRQLERAKQESAERTREAIAAQQAVADFLPQVYAQRTAVQETEYQQQQVQAEYDSALSNIAQQRRELENLIESTWQQAGYRNNMLHEVQRRIDALSTSLADAGSVSAGYDGRLAGLDAQLDAEQSQLDALESQLDVLVDRQNEAVEAEAEARAEVKELVHDVQEAGQDVEQSKKDLGEARKYDDAVRGDVFPSQRDADDAAAWQHEAQQGLTQFQLALGQGAEAGFEHYSWHGSDGHHGHQLYLPLSYYGSYRQFDFSLETGWVDSDTGFQHGHVCGWTNTTLGAKYKMRHEKNDFNIGLYAELPTGPDNVWQKSMLHDDLAHFSTLSDGGGFTMTFEGVNRLSERDTLRGRLMFTRNNSYNYRSSSFQSDDVDAFKKRMTAAGYGFQGQIKGLGYRYHVKAGGEFAQEAEYQHIGDHAQFKASLSHTSSTASKLRRYIIGVYDDANQYWPLNVFYNSDRAYNGDEWWLRFYHVKEFTACDSLQSYAVLGVVSGVPDTSAQHAYYTGLGWRHEFGTKAAATLRYNYGDIIGGGFDWLTGAEQSGYTRHSVTAEYQRQLSEAEQLTVRMERFAIHGEQAASYHGWNGMLIYSRSF